MTIIRSGLLVLDANVFIEARKRYYAFDICPAFWDAILSEHGNGNIISIDRVRDELTDPDISTWVASSVPAACWDDTKNQLVANSYAQMVAWVQANQQFSVAAKSEFASVADGWLVAYAHANNCTVVTEEIFVADIKKRVPIPNVCDAFSVPYMNTFDMLRTLGCKFTS